MAAQTVFSMEMFPVGVSMMDDNQSLSDLPRNMAAPQLVMLANVAAVTAAEGSGNCDGSVADEKEMMELKTVASHYSDSEDENVIRYSYDDQNQREVCIIEYPESPAPSVQAVAAGADGEKAEDLSRRSPPPPRPRPRPCPPPSPAAPPLANKCKEAPPAAAAAAAAATATSEGTKKKKPFHCKPCHFQAQNEQEFVEHLRSHAVSKMMVVNRVEGRSRVKDAEADESQAPPGGDGEAAAADSKGLIRCERCGYNTNRYDHYIAHLKHHSKEGDDHRVFRCTLCPYTTVSQYHWRKHLRNHFPSKLHACRHCSYFSDRKSNYIQHVRTHTGVRPFQCPYCDYSSSQKTHLTRHMRTHSGERPFKCESCNYLAANQHEVTRHARQVHNGPKPLACLYCEYKTADRSNFKKHVELHLNPRQFLCPLCKYAASKKCNLQYHIKSRHSGCNVTVDVSKVKLRVKKPGPEGADGPSKAGKVETSSDPDEDLDMDNGDKDFEPGDKQAAPINLTVRRSSKSGSSQPAANQTPEEPPRKSGGSSEKPLKGKDKAESEKKVTTRQKKTEKMNENIPTESTPLAENKAKRRVKKPPVSDPAERDHAEPELKDQKKPERDPAEEKREAKAKPRKSGSKKSVPEEAPQKPAALDPVSQEKTVRVKGTKRKAAEALDLSTSSEKLSKTRRLKSGGDKSLPKATSDEEPASSAKRPSSAAKQRKSRKSNRKSTGQEPAADKGTSGPAHAPEALETHGDCPAMNRDPESPAILPLLDKSSEDMDESRDPQDKSSENMDESRDPQDKPSEDMGESRDGTQSTSTQDQGDPSGCSSRKDTPSPVKHDPPPRFAKPGEGEEDEGIHSSHEGGSDISDSASEGSDDSGLNGNGAGSGKMANDPETPTEEIPTPTELKSHRCIFCDRTFPLEVEYRRHLNRHLVNVYYMEASKGQK